MKLLKKGLSVILSALILLSGSTAVYAQGKDGNSEKIGFASVPQEELQMNSLEEKGKNKIALFENSKTEFDIVIPDKVCPELETAVKTLQEAIEKITGGKIDIVKESSADLSKKNILIDRVKGANMPEEEDISDGYRLVIDENSISICSSSQQGTANGIYSFLEDKLGCMFLTPDDTYISSHKNIYLDYTDETDKPAVKWRDVYAYETAQNKWAAKLRLNGINTEPQNGESGIEELQYEGWGTWCHNCYDYLSPDDYFDTHPEYFSEKNGERVKEYGGRDAYLCLSNPEVFEIVKNSMAQKMKENPDKLYWDFSGNDNSSLAGCECETCKAADKAAGGTGMGTLLPFLNKLAKAFPDKYISTLAYLHTLKAPENIKTEPNVVIKLCSMPGDQACSYLNGANKNSAQFKEQVEQWSKITDNIVVWDYVVNFAHLLMPFPNFAVQAENQRFYENNNIIGVFHQASREQGGEFACLRAYVLSRLMWEGSDMNVAECVSKYVSAYYGAAADKILEYMNLCAENLSLGDSSLGLYDGLMAHYKGYLSQENVLKYEGIINQAKEEVKGDSVYEKRAEEAEISTLYAKILLPKISEEERQTALDRLNSLCESHNITMVCEWDSLENFNKISLNDTIKGEKKEMRKPLIIALCSAAGAVILATAVTVTVKIVKKRRKKAK